MIRHQLKKHAGVILFFLLLITLVSCTSESSVHKIKLGHGLDPSHPVHKAMEFMAEKVAEESGGKMHIDIYPSQQLGTERECLELLQIGSMGMTKVSSSVLESFAPVFQVFSLPYLFRDDTHKLAIFESEIGRQMLLGAEKFWLRGLCFYDAGSRSFYTKEKPILTPEDLAGLKIRTQESATSIKMVNTLGGAATPIAWGELYTALQQGVVDGAENNPPSFYTSRHYEVCKYYSLDEHTSVPDVLLISTLVWNRLSGQEQQWLQIAVDLSVKYEIKLWQEASEKALEEVQKAGVQIYHPDKTLFEQKVSSLYEIYKDTNPEIYQLIKKIKAVQ